MSDFVLRETSYTTTSPFTSTSTSLRWYGSVVFYFLGPIDFLLEKLALLLSCFSRAIRQVHFQIQSVTQDVIADQIDVLVKTLRLSQYLYQLPKTLPGALRRKLCIAIAVIADPKVCFSSLQCSSH